MSGKRYYKYNTTNTCDICEGSLIPKKAYRGYDKKGDWTGKWLCDKCYKKNERISISTTRPYYNRTNTCDRCRERLIVGNARREYKGENWTGKWICQKCYDKDYKKDEKLIADFRNCNLDQNSSSGKGYILQQVTCKVFGIKDLNIENDNFNSPIDHTRHSVYDIIQSKGAMYNDKYGWHINVEREFNKEFDNVIFYCMDKDWKNIERVYIIPWEEVIKRKTIGIYKNPIRGNQWYEAYRVDEQPYNNVYHEILKDIENGKSTILRKNANR